VEAIDMVLDSLLDVFPPQLGEWQQISVDYPAEGEGLLHIHNFEALVPELGLDPDALLTEPHAYIDRFGSYHAPL
jgi:hypothetical protein